MKRDNAGALLWLNHSFAFGKEGPLPQDVGHRSLSRRSCVWHAVRSFLLPGHPLAHWGTRATAFPSLVFNRLLTASCVWLGQCFPVPCTGQKLGDV